MQTIKGFRQVFAGLSTMTEDVNPLITNMTDKNKEIASGLLQVGYTVEQIQDFVDVSRNQLDEFIEVESVVLQRMANKETDGKKAS